MEIRTSSNKQPQFFYKIIKKIIKIQTELDSVLFRISVLWFVIMLIAGGYALDNYHAKNHTNKVYPPSIQSVVRVPKPHITASGLIQRINKLRKAKGLPVLKENAMLDRAALARAQDMIDNNYNDNTSHSPWNFVNNSGYKYSNVWLESSDNQTTNSGVIVELTNETGFYLLSSKPSDIGVGIVNNRSNPSDEVVIYLGSPVLQTVSNVQQSQGESCSQVQSTYGPQLTSDLNESWNIWEGVNYDTPAEINYEYNQSAQQDYSTYTSIMSDYGCSPQSPSPTLKYPATDPNAVAATPPATPITPTCDTTQEAIYKNNYYSAVQQDEVYASDQEQSLQNQLGAIGAGSSSATQVGSQDITQQLDEQIGQLKETLNSELISINCPTS